jgi:hypothetical protein
LWDGDNACTALVSWLLGWAMLPMPVGIFALLCTTSLLANLFDSTGEGRAIPVPREVNEDMRAKNASRRPVLRCCGRIGIAFWTGGYQENAFS